MRWFADHVGWFVGAVMLGSVALFIAVVVKYEDRADRLMAQCLADGRKEYECYSLLRRGSRSTTVVPMPVVISQ